jgi:hypothetical protein
LILLNLLQKQSDIHQEVEGNSSSAAYKHEQLTTIAAFCEYYKIIYFCLTMLHFTFYGTQIVKTHLTAAFASVRTEATDPLTYTVTAFEFLVLQTT